MKKRVVTGLSVLLCSLVASPALAGMDAVIRWNINAGRAAEAACLAPEGNALAESRIYAMVHVAVHDAVNAIRRESAPYAFDASVRRRTSLDAAVAAAARDVLVSVINQLQESPDCIAQGLARAEADYLTALAEVPNGNAKDRGVALGRASAEAIIARRADDGSHQPLVDPAYPQGTLPGEYRFTPNTPFAFAPGWGSVTPFVLKDSAQFRAGPPLAVGSAEYAQEYNEIKSLGGNNIVTPSARTAEQTEIGLFWVESSPLAWNRIARSIALRARLSPWENARLFGLLNLAMADGYIGSWETKYHYNFWRPVTAIQLGDTDGNPGTAGDPNWTPLILTYPMPDHDSAHAVEGGAAAEVLKQFFGRDRIRFSACSRTLPAGSRCDDAAPVTRSFSSFSQAASENGLSRILIGIHFRRGVEEGIEHGRMIGARAADRFLRPVR